MKATHKIAVSLTGVALLVALWGMLSLWSFCQIEAAAKTRQHSHNVINGANNLLSALKDAETSERSFLVSGEETHLKPYWAVRNSIKGDLEKLQHMTLLSAAKEYLDTLALMLDAKLAYMAHNIELRRSYDMSTVLADLHSGLGKHLMDSFRAEMSSFIQLEEDMLMQSEARFQSNLYYLFVSIVIVGLLTLLLVVSFAYSIYRETQRLVEILKQMNKQLHQANVTLQDSEEELLVTLNSIGDAVIVTDVEGRVTRLNPSAEQLTGWMQSEAAGRPVDEIFRIISQETRQSSAIPVMETLAHGTTQGVINHTLLIARDGSECAIADSCAPIHDRDAQVAGAVLVFRDVTEEYAAQQVLRDNTALIQTMLNTMVDGIIIFKAQGGILETVNPAAERMFGYDAAELIGQKASLLMPELDRDQRHDSLDYYTASNKAHAIGLRKNGSTFSVEMAVSEMWLGGQRYFTGILRDITLRKRVETERAQLYQRLSDQQFYTRSLIESNIDAIMTTDPHGIITDVNKQMEALTCCTRDELIGAPFKNYFTEPAQAEAGIKRVLIEKKVNDYELTVHGRDGKETVVSYNAATFYDRDRKLQGVFVAARDVTQSKRQDQALKEKNIELENAKAMAEKASLAKSVFLSNMSHELRTPLNAILGFAQLLEAGVPAPTATQVIRLHQIIKAGWYLLELINEILDLSVIESGKLSLSQDSVSMLDVMRECRSMVEAQAQKRNIQINFLPFDNTWFVNADRTRVKQVVLNLLSNAIKYNREYGTVEVKCSSTPKRIRISITDSGEGLSPEKLEQLFQPFNRLGQETGTEEGTGIGLVVTKQLVELMGGSISVASTVGVGSEFCIELVRDVAQQLADGKAMPTEFVPQVQEKTEPHTLLYVEDNPANLMLVEQIIEDLPEIRMLSAGDGHKGIALARFHLPDVILMDINLPGISGIEAMNILRKDPNTRHIPVIALSANAMRRDIEKGLEVGFFRYLTKPIKINEFMQAVNEALELSEMGLTKTNETEQIR